MSCQTCLHDVGADIDADSFIASGESQLSVVGGPSRRQHSDLLSLLDTHGLRQFFSTAMRCTAASDQ